MADLAIDPNKTNSSEKKETISQKLSVTNSEKQGRAREPEQPMSSAKKKPGAINVGLPERFFSMLGGVALIAYGVKKGGWAGTSMAISGGALAWRATSGHCNVYHALAISTAQESQSTHGVHVEQAITIDKSPEDLYVFWRALENQTLISTHLESVTETGPTTSHWIAKGPAGSQIEWDSEIINDQPNRLIAWKSLPGAAVENAGTVNFKPATKGRGTEVHVTIQYYPPAGIVGAGVAKLFGEEPSMQVADQLRRLKRYMETGDIVRTDGQPHGASAMRKILAPKK